MNAGTRLTSFALLLVAMLSIGAGLGATIGPSVDRVVEAPPPIGEGVVAAANGYRFVPSSTALGPMGGPFQFTITNQDNEPVRKFTKTHEKELHLIVVNRELTVFEHVHPVRDAAGTWSIDLPALAPGSYRAIADFWITDGPHLALGTDLTVAGQFAPDTTPGPSDVDHVDGYTVALRTERHDGGEITAKLLVVQERLPVTDLEPYLGADGHLVAIRTGDLAYAHVHPVDENAPNGIVTFDATLNSAGRYRLFFDFKHHGVVHTAAFTFDQTAVTGSPAMEH
jgi:hypothetical protein